MGLKDLVGGRGFTPGKFTSKFSTLASSGNLKKFKNPILKIIKDKAPAIQGGRFDSTEALRHLQSKNKLNYEEKRDIGRVFKRLEVTPVTPAEPKMSKKEIVGRALKKPNNGVLINRANFEFNSEQVKNDRANMTRERINSSGDINAIPTPPKAATPSGEETLPISKPEQASTSNHIERINFNQK